MKENSNQSKNNIRMYDMNNIIKEKEDYIKKRVHKRKI